MDWEEWGVELRMTEEGSLMMSGMRRGLLMRQHRWKGLL